MSSKKPKYKKPLRPKPTWPWAKSDRPVWLLAEPVRLAPLGGVVFALVALLFYFFRQSMGTAMPVMQVVTWVAATFVVGYAATGCFVWYVLRVSWREIPPEEKPHKHKARGLDLDDEPPADSETPQAEEPHVEAKGLEPIEETETPIEEETEVE